MSAKCGTRKVVSLDPSIVSGGGTIGICGRDTAPGLTVCLEHANKEALWLMIQSLRRVIELRKEEELVAEKKVRTTNKKQKVPPILSIQQAYGLGDEGAALVEQALPGLLRALAICGPRALAEIAVKEALWQHYELPHYTTEFRRRHAQTFSTTCDPLQQRTKK